MERFMGDPSYAGRDVPYAGREGFLGELYGAEAGLGFDRDDQPYPSGALETAYGTRRGGWGRSDLARSGDQVHTWRGGVLGWLGSGVRAAAAWTGRGMQRWGALLGGKLSGGAEQVGQALRGQGERAGSALEQTGREGMRRSQRERGRLPRSYQRPDERILDDLCERIARSGADAQEVEIEVSDAVVTLSGSVPSKLDRRIIQNIADDVLGVEEVHDHLRLARRIEGKREEQPEEITERRQEGRQNGEAHPTPPQPEQRPGA
jgi:osmotically-inducible protein OsmY